MEVLKRLFEGYTGAVERLFEGYTGAVERLFGACFDAV